MPSVTQSTPAPTQELASRELQKVVVFDFDGTVISGQSGSLISLYLFRHGLMRARYAARLVWWGVRYTLHLPYRQGEARELVFDALDGFEADDVDQLMCDFYDEVIAPRYRMPAIAEIRRRKAEGCVVIFASATFDTISDRAAELLGVDGAVGTKMARDASGNYTGQVDGAVIAGAEKYPAVARWCDEHLGPGTWRLVGAYGDHHTDEDLLARADEPYAVSPDRTLRHYARRHGWAILDWKHA